MTDLEDIKSLEEFITDYGIPIDDPKWLQYKELFSVVFFSRTDEEKADALSACTKFFVAEVYSRFFKIEGIDLKEYENFYRPLCMKMIKDLHNRITNCADTHTPLMINGVHYTAQYISDLEIENNIEFIDRK